MARRVPGNKCSVQLNFRISPAMKDEVDKRADKRRWSSSEFIRYCIEKELSIKEE